MADFDKVIPPGKEGKITVKIYGHKIFPGHIKKSYTVTTNDPENESVVLTLSGDVVKVFDVSTDIAVTGFSDEELKKEVILTNRLDKPVHLSEYRWSESTQNAMGLTDKLNVKLEPIERGQQYRLTVWNKEPLKPGHYLGDLFIKSDFEGLPEKKVMVRFTITSDVEVHPNNVIMREMIVEEGTSKSFEKKITIIAARADTLKILKVEPDREDITVNVQEIVPGKSFRCTIQLRPPTETGRYLGNLKIYTNYPGYEVLPVSITGTVRMMARKEQ
ncbi:MAG TPA: hypothetical protein VMX58_12830 [Patescibacteria group bacterium]|nr:hypothetical protein [Patescibacteria group bacterium]